MEDKLKDILSNLSSEVDQETLLLYLQGKLPEHKKHLVEKHLMQDNFDEDAIDGLQEFKNKEQLQFLVESLNRDLKKKTAKKKIRRDKLRIKDQPLLYISILILILLVALAYIFIYRMLKS